MKRFVALLLGAALLFGVDTVAMASPGPGLPAIKTVTPGTVVNGNAPVASASAYPCKTADEHFQDWFYTDGFDQLNQGVFILTKNRPPTNMCAIEAGGVSVQYQLQNSTQCLTYAGSRTGGASSYLYPLTCAPGNTKASQRWTWWSNDTITNDYTGASYCLQDNGSGYVVEVFGCDSRTHQLFTWG